MVICNLETLITPLLLFERFNSNHQSVISRNSSKIMLSASFVVAVHILVAAAQVGGFVKAIGTDASFAKKVHTGDSVRLAGQHKGDHRNLVLGGQDVDPPDGFPYIVEILATTSGERHVCGATLISPRVVLLAASCYYNVPNPAPVIKEVVVGNFFRNGMDPGGNDDGEKREVVGRYIHPRYTGKPKEGYDIAIFEIEEVSEPHPVKLDCDGHYFNKKDQTLLGWGFTEAGGSLAENLKSGSGFDPLECKLDTPDKDAEETIFCTNDEQAAGCTGDEGGPLVISEKYHDIQTGIVSVESSICSDSSITETSFTCISAREVIEWIHEIMYDLGEEVMCA